MGIKQWYNNCNNNSNDDNNNNNNVTLWNADALIKLKGTFALPAKL